MVTTSFPCDADDFRGIFVGELAQNLADNGHRVQVVTPAARPSLLPLKERFGAVEVIRSPILGWGRNTVFARDGVMETLKHSPFAALELPLGILGLTLTTCACAGKSDILISHWMLPGGLIGLLASAITGTPHIIVEHGGGARLLGSLPRFLAARVTGLLDLHTNHFMTVTPKIRQQIIELRPALAQKTTWMPVGFPCPPEPPPTLQAGPILFVGRLVPQKGAHILLQALSQVPTAVLTLAGDGPERKSLEALASALNLRSRVRFLGRVSPDRLSQLLEEHRIIAIPSLPMTGGEEGTPAILLRAMARGLVPIASRTGGIPDILERADCGVLVTPGQVQELAAGLSSLFSSPARFAELSRGAGERASAFSWKKHLEVLTSIFEEIEAQVGSKVDQAH